MELKPTQKSASIAVALAIVAAQFAFAPSAVVAAHQRRAPSPAPRAIAPLYIEGASGTPAATLAAIQPAGEGTAPVQQPVAAAIVQSAAVVLNSTGQIAIAVVLPQVSRVAISVESAPAPQPAYELAQSPFSAPVPMANVEPAALRVPAPRVQRSRLGETPDSVLPTHLAGLSFQKVKTYSLLC